MALENARRLGVYPMESIVKIGDTLPDIEEGLNAGMWTIGLAKTGNEIGLTEQEIEDLSKDMQSWTYRIIADSSQGGIGYSESDSVRLPSGRFVAIYGNNAGSPWFFETHSDDEGHTWAPMRQLNFNGDSPSMIQLAGGQLLAAIRSLRPSGQPGIGLVTSEDQGQTWTMLKNIHDQANRDMGYPDLVRLPDDRILCVYYTAAEPQPIPNELQEKLAATEPHRTIFKGGIRPAAYGEFQSEIRGVFLNDLTV